jgi:competence protein ComEC
LAFFIAFVVVFPYKRILVLFLPFGLFIFGVSSVTVAQEHYRVNALHEGEISGIARVTDDPEEKSFYQQVIVRIESCVSGNCPQEKILWQAPRTVDIVAGAKVSLSCILTVPKNFDPEFDYRMFLAKDNIGYVCQKALRAEIEPDDFKARLMRWFFLPKRSFERALNASLPQPEAGLAAGLVIGGDNRLPETLKDGFVSAGLSHIVAISGYNIALIAQGFVLFGIGIGLWRKQALWFAIIGIILFILLVGAPASAVRAGIMGVCAFAAFFFGRMSRSINMLLLACAVMLFFQPLLLRFDIGFQLSFLATLAIITAAPFVNQFVPKEFVGRGFVEIALLTFAVELFVVPLIVYQFHIFSTFALFMNILLLPLVPYAMMATSITVLGFFLLPGLHVVPAGIAYGILRIITYAVERLSTLSSAVVTTSIHPLVLLFWYVFLFLVIVVMKKYFIRKYVQTKNIL